MILSKRDDRFILKCTHAERRAPQRAGFRFDKELKVFFTKDLKVAARLREYADIETRKILDRVLITVSPWPGRIRYPKGLKPLAFQPGAARFAIERNRAYIAASPGLGKTIIAALIMNADPDAIAVYICPPFLTTNVECELVKWTTPRRLVKIQGRDLGITTGVNIIPDSLLHKETVHNKIKAIVKYARARGRKVILFVDEAHRFKNDTSGRSLYLYEGICPLIERRVYLSGTPMPTRPLDLYPVLANNAPETINFMNKFEFGIRYCAGKRNKFGWDFKGSSNIKDLASRVMGAFMLRLRKDLLGLPPLTEGVVIIGENLTPALHALDTAILREHSPEDLMGYLAPNAHVATYRKELGKLKAKAALPFIKSIIEDTEDNLIVVTVHREVIKIISEGLTIYNPSIISGDVPTNKRLEIAKAWQADTTKRVMILNNIAGGLGFNLTKANRVVFVEFSWGYEDNRQVYDRAHRHGQENAVHVDYLIFKNSIDRKVIEVTERKRALGAYL